MFIGMCAPLLQDHWKYSRGIWHTSTSMSIGIIRMFYIFGRHVVSIRVNERNKEEFFEIKLHYSTSEKTES